MIDHKEKKNKIITKKKIYFFFLILLIFFFDRYTKLFVLNNFTENTYYLNDYINLDLIWNIGIGFGLMSTESDLIYNSITFLIGIVLLFLIFFLIISDIIDKTIYTIIIGGALGNFYDRLIFRAVPDFIDIHYKNFHWFTFNVADIFISLGIIFFIIRSFFVKNKT